MPARPVMCKLTWLNNSWCRAAIKRHFHGRWNPEVNFQLMTCSCLQQQLVNSCFLGHIAFSFFVLNFRLLLELFCLGGDGLMDGDGDASCITKHKILVTRCLYNQHFLSLSSKLLSLSVFFCFWWPNLFLYKTCHFYCHVLCYLTVYRAGPLYYPLTEWLLWELTDLRQSEGVVLCQCFWAGS